MTRTKNFTSQLAGRKHLKFLVPGLLFIGTILLIVALSFIDWNTLYEPLQNVVFSLEENYKEWLGKQNTANPLILLLLAFVGGLIGSISPCHIGLLTVNLTYIGTREVTSRRDAFVKAASFVLGVVTVLSLLGLVSSFAGAVMRDYRGHVNIVVGLVVLLMGLTLLEIIRLPLPQFGAALPITGPYTAGVTFALVSSPCASPVLFSVLTAAAATGSQVQSTLTMVSYALGTSALIFFASLFTGLAKQARTLVKYSEWIMRIGGGLLIIMGGFYLYSGISWVLTVAFR
ncbi:cytochrome c biogenesis CcdA family protein [Allocoleopsis franciscana]|uniref:Cytochrome c biogenesis protein n=1 Tax=Allocoleopsis franciscana PCC 7113 TaxID=1173027 RepID=K9W979_9CYAN|nr:cytochrome c biogenesis protein CcdA [Allocoleopsis franciscana]AFZ16788.1 cytochrome c biogenesis protein [Allocoleopsis franciscana PCC 7113]